MRIEAEGLIVGTSLPPEWLSLPPDPIYVASTHDLPSNPNALRAFDRTMRRELHQRGQRGTAS